jgi:hypothetical protein
MEQENIRVSDYCEKLVSIETIADGSCLIHAILKASNITYQNTSDVEYRKKLAIHYRRLLSEEVLKPDENYSTIKEMANLIRCEYKTEIPRNFMEFLRMTYNYTSSYISYPEPILNENELKKYSSESIKKYILDYKGYLVNFNQKIESKTSNFVKSPFIVSVKKSEDTLLSENDIRNISILKKVYSDLEEVIDSHVKNLKAILEMTMSYCLYLPTYYNENIIEKVLEYKTEGAKIIPVNFDDIPKGKYHYLPFNCKLFTISKAVSIMKFEFEYHNLDNIVKLSDISNHLNSRRFIGDGDAMLYVPYLFHVNLIVIDFDTGFVLATYENEHSQYYVIINNENNVHFETVGLIDEETNKISTMFEKESPIIQECLNQKILKNFKI